jgi:predicted small secreted protein
MKEFLLMVMCIFFMSTLFGCGTIRGLGEDLSGIGKAISRSSDHVKDSVKKD